MTARDGGEVVVLLLLLLWMSSDGGGVLLLRQPLAMIVVHPDRLLTADRWGKGRRELRISLRSLLRTELESGR